MGVYDLVIVGAGPAGLTAAIYAGRQGMKAIILEMMIGSGSGYMVPAMENYPGFEKISGKNLLEIIKKQAEEHVIIKNMEEVKDITVLNNKNLEIITSKGEYRSRAVIISTGSRHRRLKVPGEIEFIGRGVCYCATCDGPLYKGKDVMMIGGGNAAVQEALYLESMGCKVTIVHRRDELRAEKYLQEKLKEKNIPIIWDSVVEEIKGDAAVDEVVLYNRKEDVHVVVETSGVFIAIGEEPLNEVAKSAGVELDGKGYIKVDKFQRTSIPGLYAAGDITGGIKQWVVACSEGAVAALFAHKDNMD
ncbi:MAG: thioredoxin-disulfide reductase [Euryarchaeota archaeon]|jgi:thioredoxin reductase (NADPH)|nr:thioredoxin-disulfide reductase [Euryarchaeota archaeon]HNS24678.1 thioredoxin-disulfide reductase [Methanobacteriaceae archaeon]